VFFRSPVTSPYHDLGTGIAFAIPRAKETKMQTESRSVADRAAVGSLIDAVTKAVRAKDVEEIVSHCTDDVVVFDMVPPLAHEGREAMRRVWADAMGPFAWIDYEVRDLDVVMGDDVAFARSLVRFGGTGTDGKRSASWMRSSLGLRKTGGKWQIAHQHVSVPFDMETGRAMLDLKP
jgi:uncharacterized protein (TIGR02246 family)